jgi:hypothetical protein
LVALSKEFQHGGVVFEASRSDGFSGVISNRFYDRYDVTVRRSFTHRLECSASASYIQQQRSGARNATGQLDYADAHFRLSHNWSIFGQARHMRLVADQRFGGTENSAIVGFRWSWTPENP